MKAIRRLLIFVAILGLGLLGLWLATRSDQQPSRRGLRIEEVDADPAEHVPFTFLPLRGLPHLLGSNELRVSRFEHVQFPEAPGELFEILAWHLAVDGMDMVRQRALGPVFTLYPRPESPIEARAFIENPPERVVLLRADQATVVKKLMAPPTGGGDMQEQWEINLVDNVSVSSLREGQKVLLLTDDLRCLSTDRRVFSSGLVKITADEYVIAGKGLSGDAELGTFSVFEDVEVTLPTAALIGDGQAVDTAGSETRVTSTGPLLVERLGSPNDEGPVRTRVRFQNGTTVRQEGQDGAPPDKLSSRELTLLLTITREDKENESASPKVVVRDVRAEGNVVLERGNGSRVSAAGLHLTRTETGDRVKMEGPLSIRHRGVLPGAAVGEGSGGGGDEQQENVVLIKARDSATIVSGGKEDPVHTTFTGQVFARRETPEGEELLALKSDALAVTSDPKKGETMVATGSASFSAPTASGRADRIHWHRNPDGGEVIRLEGSPRVEVVGGGGFNPFGAPARKTEDGESPGILILSCDGPMILASTGDRRELLMTEQVRITKVVDGRKVLYLEAARVTGTFAKEVLELLTADGGVTASGRGEAQDSGRYLASGDQIEYSQVSGQAVLTGNPASVRLEEEGDRVNEIQARRLTFLTNKNLFIAEEEVTAVVYLAESKGEKIRPYTLSCVRLEVVPGQSGPSTRPAKPSGGKQNSLQQGRISSLVALGPLSLAGRRRVATGDRLVYEGRGAQRIDLTGKPARITQPMEIGEQTYEDIYESSLFTLTLAERDIEKAKAPRGGRFTLHRPYGQGSPAVLGGRGRTGDIGRVERFVGSCSGPSSYDTKVARLVGNARIEQYAGQGDSFTRIAEFKAQKIEAWRGIGPDGRPQLVRARGEGTVRGSGTDWRITCDFFEVDLKTHQTRMKGNPAEVHRQGMRPILVREAVYDYQRDNWVELINFSR